MKVVTVLKSVVVFMLAAALFFVASDVYLAPSSGQVIDTPETPSLSIGDIRSASPLDMSASDPFFDAVCYLLYNKYISEGFEFVNFEAIT